jgi:beta-glucosidase
LLLGGDFANWYQKFSITHSNHSIPAIIYDEGVHGLYGWGRTVFPQAIAQAATFNPQLLHNIGRAVAAESRSLGINFLLSPVLDLAREPRYGRVEETFGEDTYLCSVLGEAVVRGYQGSSLFTNFTVAAEPKHFTAHGIPEGGHNAGIAHVGRRELYDTYLPVFKAALVSANARGIMSAYQDIDGIPCTANKWVLTDVLRNEWGFDGIALSDGGAIRNLVEVNYMAESPADAITYAINAGLDVDMGSYDGPVFIDAIVRGVSMGLINQSRIDNAVSNILRVKYELGLFDNPYVDLTLAKNVIRSKTHTDLALRCARESIILLHNKNILPLNKNKTLNIAVVGPSADTLRLGDYTGVWDQELPEHSAGAGGVTFLEGLIAAAQNSKSKINYRVGTGILSDDETQLIRKSHLSKGMGLKAEYYNNSQLSGAPVITTTEDQLEWYWDFFAPYSGLNFSEFSARYTGQLNAVFSVDGALGVVTNGGFRLYVDNKLLMDAWSGAKKKINTVPFTFTEGQSYNVVLEFRKFRDGNGFLLFSWDLVGANSFNDAVQVASKSDIAIIVVGDSKMTSGETYDRAELTLAGKQQQLVEAVANTGVPTIVIIMNGRPVIVYDFVDKVDAIINAFYPGEAQGIALTEVLFGDVNPSGRLPISVPKSVGQLPIYYNYKPAARHSYVDLDYQPHYSFGYGLSYTKFDYRNFTYLPQVSIGGSQSVSVEVFNTGDHGGEEVVQLYVRDLVSSVSTPIRQLKRFSKVYISAHSNVKVQFLLPVQELELLNADMRWVVEPGSFNIWVGNSSTTGLVGLFRVV